MLRKSQFKQLGIQEKIVRSKHGTLLCVRFAVAEIDGEVCARILSAEPLRILAPFTKHHSRNTNEICLLAGAHIKSTLVFAYQPKHSVSSPFFNKFSFFTSQPTRAPSSL